jgi:hypothetical protein
MSILTIKALRGPLKAFIVKINFGYHNKPGITLGPFQ